MEQSLATLAPIQSLYISPVVDVQGAVDRYNAVNGFISSILKENIDFGKVPGSDKDTLLKPGAEKLASFFGLSPRFILEDKVEDWTGENHGGEPFFYYRYKCQLFRGDYLIAEGEGSCNSWEKKYRYRWVNEMDMPANVDKDRLEYKDGAISEFSFAIDKAETSGKYGKPAAYWKLFKDAIANGTARKFKKKAKDKEYDAYEIGGKLYAVPNRDVADQVNTLQKMSQKRSLIAPVLIATNASARFTQDVEDFQDVSTAHVEVYDGEYEDVKPAVKPAEVSQPEQEYLQTVDHAKATPAPVAKKPETPKNITRDLAIAMLVEDSDKNPYGWMALPELMGHLNGLNKHKPAVEGDDIKIQAINMIRVAIVEKHILDTDPAKRPARDFIETAAQLGGTN